MLLAGFQLGAGNQSHMEAHAAIITVAAAAATAAAADGDDDDAVATAVSDGCGSSAQTNEAHHEKPGT